MPVACIFNPTAHGERARRRLATLAALQGECRLFPTTKPGEAVALAAAALEAGFDTLVAAGGDGTVNEVANGMASVPDGLRRARLAVLPWGSVNVFAKELQLPENPADAWKVMDAGRERCVDLLWTDFRKEGQAQRRCFVQLAGAGLDARAVELVRWDLKKRLGDLAYVWAGWQALGGALPCITARVGGHELSGQLVLIGNGRYYGGRNVLFPKAQMADGLLDVLVIEEVRRSRLLQYGWAALRDRLPQLAGAQSAQGATVELTAAERVPLEMDGDAVGELPATITVAPKALRVVVP